MGLGVCFGLTGLDNFPIAGKRSEYELIFSIAVFGPNPLDVNLINKFSASLNFSIFDSMYNSITFDTYCLFDPLRPS